MEKLELQKIANEVRKDIVTALHSAKAGHPGGSLSAADVFTYLYFEEMNIDPKDPKKADRDRFVLSKGHTAPGYYSALAERGFFPKAPPRKNCDREAARQEFRRKKALHEHTCGAFFLFPQHTVIMKGRFRTVACLYWRFFLGLFSPFNSSVTLLKNSRGERPRASQME